MTDRYRIAQIVYDLDEVGGAERVVIDLANHLSKTQTSCVISLNSKNVNSSKENFNFKHLKLKPAPESKISSILFFISLIKSNKINILHAHNYKPLVFCIIAYFLVKDVKIIFHDHNPFRKHEWNLIIKQISKRVVRNWICVSEKIKTSALNFVNSDKVMLIDNPVDTNKFYFRNKNIVNENIKFVIVANYREQKNHQILIEFLSSTNMNNLVIDCYGLYLDSSYGNILKKLVEKYKMSSKINLYGPSHEISSLLDKYDFGILVSKNEGLPISLLEYMSKGLPVIVPDVGQCKDIVDNANCGIVFKKNDVASLSNAFIQIFDNKDKWRLWGRNGRQYVKENHSIDNFGKKIYDIYNKSKIKKNEEIY